MRIRLIENPILLVAKTDAADTILATVAVVTLDQIVGICTVLREKTLVAFFAGDAFITKFGITNEERVNTILGVIGVAIKTILGVNRPENHVTVFAFGRVVAVVAVLIVVAVKGANWDNFLKFVKLIEKGTGEVKVSGVFKRIPYVTPPFVASVDLEIFAWMIAGENFCAADGAFDFVEMPLVAEGKTPSAALLGRECRKRNLEVCEERFFSVGDGEGHTVFKLG